MKSVMKHQFSQVPKADIPRSSFDRSHGYKTTFNSGWLIPVFCDLAYPGDTFSLRMNTFARLATPLHPFMDNMFMDAFFFAVPLRLLQTNFQRMMGEQDNPGDSISYLVPQITIPVGGFTELSMFDYMGVPTKVGAGKTVSAYWPRAYNQIIQQWFKDQNLQTSPAINKGDGPDVASDYPLWRRGKRHDYFTSCLPWPQKGPAVPLPLGTSAPVYGIGTENRSSTAGPINAYETGKGATTTAYQFYRTSSVNTASDRFVMNYSAGTNGNPLIYADLSVATAATINQLRLSFQIQRLYERDARGGTRYTEIIQSHFGVTSPDARLQRPEYLGGGSVPFNVNPIAQTAPTLDDTTPQGNLAAMGTSAMHGVGFTKSFTEHSVVIGLVSVRADLNYQQGLNKMWSYLTKHDFYWPALSHLGEQAVLNKEIYMDGSANDDLAFGYQERWAEMRYKPSLITGLFRSNAVTSLDTWHLAQDFSALPVLNASFIVENPPVERVVAVESEPQILFDSYFSYRCARPLPTYSVPGLIDHF